MYLAPFALILAGAVRLEGPNILIEFDPATLHSRVLARFGAKPVEIGPLSASETLRVSGNHVKNFALKQRKLESVRDQFGSGRRLTVTGTAPSLSKTVAVTVYHQFPRMAVLDVEYTNTGPSDLAVHGWTNHQYVIAAAPGAPEPAFWSYQSGSYKNRPDWVLPLKPGFQQDNFLGMNSSDYGGGTPISDVWRRDVGVGVGHLEPVPKLVSLPVTAMEGQATVAVSYQTEQTLKPGASLKTFRTFVAVHQRDYFDTLTGYRRAMMKQGVTFPAAPESAFGPVWCAWGYGRNFTPAQVYGALPIVKKIGFTWVTVDDGWQTAEGDWYLEPKKFPNGDRDMRAIVDRVHADGFKAQLWWAPLAADDGTDLLTKHPEQLLLNANGSRQRITWWNAWYVCPADPAAVEHHRKLVVKMIRDWDYDGLKLDGQHMNGVPPCYNPAHRHARPEESVEALPRFFKMIYDTARSIKPDALVEFCPCGTAFSFHLLPYMNMSVASDPRSSWQIRTKGKTLKALHGDGVAYFGDHVELSTGRQDFASTVGIGGVVGTNFTWPVGSAEKSRTELTPERETIWEKWVKLYNSKMLSRGEYLGNLYDIGFDRPEAHVIRKGNSLYYAFFAPQHDGKIELRGLRNRVYRVIDYENGKDVGTVRGPEASLQVQFQNHLLLEVSESK